MARRKHSPSALADPKVSIVIPVYNEKNTIDEILRRVTETEPRKEVIIVDDCSNDGTRERLKGMAALQAKGEATAPAGDGGDPVPLADLRFFFQAQNQGKGAALRRGFAQVTGDIVLVQDADLEYDPRDYPKLLEPIVDGRADVVYGSRFLGGPQRVHYFWHYVANMALTLLSDIATNLKLTDMETCYKVFRAGDYGEDREEGLARVRSPDLLCRPHLRRRKKDHLERRRTSAVVHHQVQIFGLSSEIRRGAIVAGLVGDSER
jgi:glycosyltransferase involved in cell wall biosynthesis